VVTVDPPLSPTRQSRPHAAQTDADGFIALTINLTAVGETSLPRTGYDKETDADSERTQAFLLQCNITRQLPNL
jgi:hypothetical protein